MICHSSSLQPSEADITVKALEEPDWNQVWDIVSDAPVSYAVIDP